MATTHSPYAFVPAGASGASNSHKKRQRPPPSISRLPFSHTLAVLKEVQAVGAGYSAVPRFGWRVLQRLWRVTPADFDSVALAHLLMLPPFMQQHVLLMLATTDIRDIKNLSAFLSRLVQEVGERVPVCLGFIAGCCQSDAACPFTHPPMSPAWQLLQQRWQVGWLDFDYLVLNSLLLKPKGRQEEVLCHLARMKLKNVRNPSALLSSIILQCEGTADLPTVKSPATHQPHRISAAATAPSRSSLNTNPGPLGATEGEVDSLEAGAVSSRSEASDGTVGPSDATSDEGILEPLCGSQRSSLSWADQLEMEEEEEQRDRERAIRHTPLDLPIPYQEAGLPVPTMTPCDLDTALFTMHSTEAATAVLTSTSGPFSGRAQQDIYPLVLETTTTAVAEELRFPGAGIGPVVQLLRGSAIPPPPVAGWEVLHRLWGFGPANFEPAALRELSTRTPSEQEHILFSLAAMDHRQTYNLNLTALLRVALGTTQPPVCWRHLAGLCCAATPAACPFHHPDWVPAWDELGQQGISYLHLDYAILNVLLRLPPHLQQHILTELLRQKASPMALTGGLSDQLWCILEPLLRQPH